MIDKTARADAKSAARPPPRLAGIEAGALTPRPCAFASGYLARYRHKREASAQAADGQGVASVQRRADAPARCALAASYDKDCLDCIQAERLMSDLLDRRSGRLRFLKAPLAGCALPPWPLAWQ